MLLIFKEELESTLTIGHMLKSINTSNAWLEGMIGIKYSSYLRNIFMPY